MLRKVYNYDVKNDKWWRIFKFDVECCNREDHIYIYIFINKQNYDTDQYNKTINYRYSFKIDIVLIDIIQFDWNCDLWGWFTNWL